MIKDKFELSYMNMIRSSLLFKASREETAKMAKKLEWLKTDFYLHDHVQPRRRKSKSRKSYSCYSFEEENDEDEDVKEEEVRRVRYCRSPSSSPPPPTRRRQKSYSFLPPRLPRKHE